MKSLKAIAVAAVLTVSSAGLVFAQQSPLTSLSSATTLSFETVTGPDAMSVNSGANSEQVDLESLKALIAQNPQFLAQLESYGATIEDVVGIKASDETDVTIYVMG